MNQKIPTPPPSASIEYGTEFTLAIGQSGLIVSTGSAAQNGKPAVEPAALTLTAVTTDYDTHTYHFQLSVLSGAEDSAFVLTKEKPEALKHMFSIRLISETTNGATLLLTLNSIP